jgi:hypothetical protein
MDTYFDQHEQINNLSNTLKTVMDDVALIKTALLGDMKEKGWLSRIREIEYEINKIEELRSRMSKMLFAFLLQLVITVSSFLFLLITHKVMITW